MRKRFIKLKKMVNYFYMKNKLKGDIVTTAKFLLEGSEKKLIEHYQTEMTLQDETLTVSEKNFLNNTENVQTINLNKIKEDLNGFELAPMVTNK